MFRKLFLNLILPLVLTLLALFASKEGVLLGSRSGMYIFFLLAIITSVWFSSFLSGIFVTILSTLLINFFLLEPYNTFKIDNVPETSLLIIFFVVGVIISAAIEKTHESMVKTQQNIKDLMESINYGFVIIDKDLKIGTANKEILRLIGKEHQDVIGKGFFDIFPELIPTEFYSGLKESFKKKIILSLEQYFDSAKKWFRVNTMPYFDNKKIAVYFKDVTESKVQDQEFRKIKMYFDRILESNIIGLVFYNSSDGIYSANDAFLNMLGYTYSDIENKILEFEKLTPEKYKNIDDLINKEILKEGVSNIYEKEFISKDGTLIPVMVGVSMIDPLKNLCLSFVVDIRERKKIEQELSDSKDKFMALVNSVNDTFVFLDKDKRLIGIYGQSIKKNNMDVKQFIGKEITDIPGINNIDKHIEALDKVLKGESVIYEWEGVNKDGEKTYMQNSAAPSYDVDNNIEGVVLVIRDITELKNIQSKLDESTKQVASILESITDGFIALDKEWKFTYINTQAEKYFNKDREELTGQKIWDVFPALIGSVSYENFNKAVSEKKSITFEDRYEPLNHWFDIHLYPTEEGLGVYFTDINSRKEADKRIEQLHLDINNAKKKLDNILSNIPGIVWETFKPEEENKDRNYVSDYIFKMTGYTKEEWLNTPKFWLKIMHPDDRETAWNESSKISQTGKEGTIQYRWITKDNRVIWTETHSVPIKDEKGEYIGMRGMTTDITKRKAIEEELRKSEEQLSIIFENVADGITVQDKTGKIVYANNQAAKSFGFKSNKDILTISKDENKQLYQIVSQNYIIKDESGDEFTDLSKLPSRLALKGELNPQTVLCYEDRKTKKEYWYEVKSRPIFDENNEVILAVTILIDITERREVEKRKDEFISIASHELKTPLTTVKAFTQILLNKFTKASDKESGEYLTKMDKQVNRLTHIVSDLLDISRIEAGKLKLDKENFNLQELVKDVVENLDIVNKSHHINLLTNPEAMVYGDKGRIEQVLINLINNAVKYSPNKDKVEITSEIINNEVIISIKDFGVGIAEDERERIFERFYMGQSSQKSRFYGLGLGLYISSEIIRRHKGRIWVESDLGKGSRFFFSLPLAQ